MAILCHLSSQNGAPAPLTTMLGRNLALEFVTRTCVPARDVPLDFNLAVLPPFAVHGADLARLVGANLRCVLDGAADSGEALLARHEYRISVLEDCCRLETREGRCRLAWSWRRSFHSEIDALAGVPRQNVRGGWCAWDKRLTNVRVHLRGPHRTFVNSGKRWSTVRP